MTIRIAYCAVWNYEPRAVSLTEKILAECKQRLKELQLVPTDGGRFEVSINGDLIYSKLQTGQFPDEHKIVAEVVKRAG